MTWKITAWHERAAHLSGRLKGPSIQLVGIEPQVCELSALLKGIRGALAGFYLGNRRHWQDDAAGRCVLLAVCAGRLTDLDAATLGVLAGASATTTAAALQRLIPAHLLIMAGNLDSCRFKAHSSTSWR